MLYREGVWVGTAIAAVATTGVTGRAGAETATCVGSIVAGTVAWDTGAFRATWQLVRNAKTGNPAANNGP
jgi:hypothetical protein